MSEKTEMVLFSEIWDMSEKLQSSKLLPPELHNKAADIAVVVMAGRELGLGSMAAVRGLHVIKGKPVLSADVMVALVLGSGKAEYFEQVESTAEKATYATKRKGSKREQRYTFTAADAARAGLRGDNWTKYPDAMLRARAKSTLARDAFPDVLAGCYETDEAPEIAQTSTGARFEAPSVPEQSEVIIDAEVVEEGNDPRMDILAAINEATTLDQLAALIERIKALPDDQRKSMQGPYRERQRELKEQAQ